MKNRATNSELTILLISDNDTDIVKVNKKLEDTMGRRCHLWHCPSVVRSSDLFKKALSEIDIVLLDHDLAAPRPQHDVFPQLQKIVQGLPIIIFMERSDNEPALLVVEGEADNIILGHFTTDPCKLRNAIEFAMARSAIARDLEQQCHEEFALSDDRCVQSRDIARIHEATALVVAMAEASVTLGRASEHANENLRQGNELPASPAANVTEYGDTLLAAAKLEGVADLLNTATVEEYKEKGPSIHWLCGGFSIENDPDKST